MKINITREIRKYNESHERKMTYERLAGLCMPDFNSGLKTKIRILARMNAGKSSHPGMELVWLIATTLGITVDQLIQK